MNYSNGFRALALICLAVTVSCGKNDILNTQENQRGDVLPEMRGAWVSLCESSQIVTLTFDSEKLTVVQDKFHDAECKDIRRTTTNSGIYSLAHNFKDGINNSVVFVADPTFQVALHYDIEVEGQNNVLTGIQNEREKPIDITASTDTKREITRENLRLREAKALDMWKRGLPKALNRLQWEKVSRLGLGETPMVDFGTRAAFRYEMDNGFLQIAAPQIGNRVYSKK